MSQAHGQDPRTDPARPYGGQGLSDPGLMSPNGASGAAQVDSKQYVRILSRQKWLLAGIAATILLGAIVQYLTATPLYVALSTVQIDPIEVPGSSAPPAKTSRQDLDANSRRLWTRDLARGVVEQLALAQDSTFNSTVRSGILIDVSAGAIRKAGSLFGATPQPGDEEEAAVDRLLSQLIVRQLPKDAEISVSFRSPSPQQAARVVNSLVDAFLEQNLEIKRDTERAEHARLSIQLDNQRLRVEEAEGMLLAFSREKNISDSETVVPRRIATLNDLVTRARSEMIRKRARYRAASAGSPNDFPEALEDGVIEDLESKVFDVTRELSALSKRFGPEWPAVKDAELRLNKLKQQLTEEKRRATEGARQDFELATKQYEELSSVLASEEGRLSDTLIEYSGLKRNVEAEKAVYRDLLERSKEARMAVIQPGNVKVTRRATPPAQPSSPDARRVFGLAVFLTLFFGAAAVLVAESLDDSIRSSADLTRVVGWPTLGLIPHLGHAAAASGASNGGPMQLPLTASGGSQPLAWEAYRALRTSLLQSGSGQPLQALLVTSALPDDGKTTTAANMAIALSKTGKRTLLVDLDLRRPGLAGLFKVDAPEGIGGFLSGNGQRPPQITATEFEHLFLLPAGPAPPNPGELIDSEAMRRSIQRLKQDFEYVVIDSPPTLGLTDARVLSTYVDGVILVARSGKTPREALKRAGDSLSNVGARILGVLLNDADAADLDYEYASYASYEESTPMGDGR